MLTNFEELTEELNDYELTLVPVVIRGFGRYTKGMPIKSPDVVRSMQAKGYKITGVRLRKICGYIRRQGLLPLVGTSKGYYVSYEPAEVQKQIKSLQERARIINEAAEGLKKFL